MTGSVDRSLISDTQNHEGLALISRVIVSRSDTAGLQVCAFLRNRYDSASVSSEPHSTKEAQLLWKLRDDITAQLLESPLACERNLKLALLFDLSVPHPCLDRDCKAMSRNEEWILEEEILLISVFGPEGMARMLSAHAKGGLTSASFLVPDGATDVKCRAVRLESSRLDERTKVLLPLYRHVGLCPDTGRQIPFSAQSVPRSWVSGADEARFRESCARTMLTTLSDRYCGPDVPGSERAREGAQALLRHMAQEYPYIMAEAVRSCRGLSPLLDRELQKIVRERVRHAFNERSEGRRETLMCEAVALVSSVGLGRIEFSSAVMDEFGKGLANTAEQELDSAASRACTAAANWLTIVTPDLESRSVERMLRHPNTTEASLLACYLFQVRCPDPTIKEFACAQALRPDLNPTTWLNYAHAALGFGLEQGQIETLRDVFARTYMEPLEVLSWRDSGVRKSYRLFTGAAYPERIGSVTSLTSRTSGLMHSRLEERVLDEIAKVSGVRVSKGVFIPWAPAIDGTLFPIGAKGSPKEETLTRILHETASREQRERLAVSSPLPK